MDITNICLGAFIEKDGRDMTGLLYDTMKAEFIKEDISIGMFDLFTNKDQVENAIKGNKYDIVICQENLNGESIGAGSIKRWRQLNSRVRVILIINKQKKGGRKLESLYKDADYYDAVYDQDISGMVLKSLVDTPRAKEKAFSYYGFVGAAEEPQTPYNGKGVVKVTNEGVSSGVEEKENDGTVTDSEKIGEEGNGKMNQEDTAYGSEEFAKEFKDMEYLFPESIEEGGDEVMERDIDAWEGRQGEKENSFAGDDLFKNTLGNHVEGDEQTGKRILDSYIKEEREFMTGRTGGTMVVPVTGYQTIPVYMKGMVQAVIDTSLIMVGLSAPISEDNIQNRFITVLVQTEQKGHMEDGKYKASNMAIRAYENCFIDEMTVILEVPDQDMTVVEGKIVGKKCNMILKNI